MKVKAIHKIFKFTTKKELRSLFVLDSYYQIYLRKFHDWYCFILNLCTKSIANLIPWNSDAKKPFQNLKEKLEKMSSMFTFKLDRPLQLIDASANIVGAYRAQMNDHPQKRQTAFFSKNLMDTQMKIAQCI